MNFYPCFSLLAPIGRIPDFSKFYEWRKFEYFVDYDADLGYWQSLESQVVNESVQFMQVKVLLFEQVILVGGVECWEHENPWGTPFS